LKPAPVSRLRGPSHIFYAVTHTLFKKCARGALAAIKSLGLMISY
jgi:hypothetical protein